MSKAGAFSAIFTPVKAISSFPALLQLSWWMLVST